MPQILLTEEEHKKLAPAAPLKTEIAALETSLKSKQFQIDAMIAAVKVLPDEPKALFFAEYKRYLQAAGVWNI